MSTEEQQEEFYLELGDIIKMNAPENSDLDGKTFYIDYLDKNRATIVDPDTLAEYVLDILEGNFTDESIQSIEILSRPEEVGYARQNGLTTGAWISIQFGGEVPLTVNGQITDLEEDMIEITTYGNNKKIYIDFGYKGIPLDLPIENIRTFEPPAQKAEIPDLEISPEKEDESDTHEEDLMDIQPVLDVKANLKQVLLDADAVSFGEELEAITELVPVKETEKRFGMQTQTNDLLDDLLSSIPTAQRTPVVLNKIHNMIERFKQLKDMFSFIDKDGTDNPVIRTAQYKPLVERLEQLNKKLYWILPIVKNRKKLYNINVNDEDNNDDFISLTLAETQIEYRRLVDEYKHNRVPDGQNKYFYLMRNLQDLLTPFTFPLDKSNVITEKSVESNILAVMDNLEDFYTTAAQNELPVRCRFVLTGYDESLSHLTSKDLKKTLQTASRVPFSSNDKMNITGFLTLPEPALIYSRINLPTSSILLKAQLNKVMFNYFSILKRNTSVIQETITETSDEGPKYTADTFLEGFKAIRFLEEEGYGDRGENAYKDFLKKMVPKTRVLFDLIKKFIEKRGHGLSYLQNIQYLEPFLVYPDDITFKQYETIVKFMEKQILEFKREFISRTTDIQKFLKSSYGDIPRENLSILLSLLPYQEGNENNIVDLYGLSMNDSDTVRMINTMTAIDNMRLFTTALALQDKDLYQSIDIQSIIEGVQKENKEDEEKARNENTECKNFVLAKKYIDIDDLREDDNTADVYFDSKYDTTRYDIGDEYKDSREVLDDDSYREFIFKHLMDNVGLNQKQAIIESEALTKGKRRVTEGDYALIETSSGLYFAYYKRSADNTWVRDTNLDGLPPDSEMFCNIKKSCLQINKECGTVELNRTKVEGDLTKEIMSQFDLELNMEYENLMKTLQENQMYYTSILPALKLINIHKFIKTDLLKLSISDTLQAREVIVSPYANLRDHILSQSDFVKKQTDILTFVDKFCRDAFYSPTDPENAEWFYCKKTNTMLLPTFYESLALAFQRGEYVSVLEKICADRGQISDDGDKIVDKHSGYVIRTIEYDKSEGFDEAGYRVVSREVLEKDIGEVLIDMSYKEMPSLQSPDSEMIYRVLAALDTSLGIKTDSQYDFVIGAVTNEINHYIGSKSKYMERQKARQAKTGKKIIPYEKAHDDTLLVFTLAYYLIAIQTMIPSIITKKTFPGCVRSFVGFPLDEEGETSALLYLVCAVLKLRQSSRPWSALPRVTRKKEESVTNKYAEKLKKRVIGILENSTIQQKLISKRQYLERRVDIDDIPELFDVGKWNTFLPPLFDIKMKQVSNISKTFESVLISNLENGNDGQFAQLNSLRGKIIAFSFHIQELIQRVINKEAPLLKNLSDEPMLENACCNEGIRETLLYFADKEGGIRRYNNMVKNLERILSVVDNYETINYIFSPLDTHLRYANPMEQFSEETMFVSFLRFCEFNIPFDETIARICDNPIMKRINGLGSIKDKIERLRQEGIDINRDNFRYILNAVNATNIVDINLHPVILSERRLLEIKIEELKQKKTPVICNPEILDAFQSLIDTFDTIRQGEDDSYNAMNTFLDRNIEHFQEEITTYLSNFNVTRGVERFFDTMTDWKLRGQDIYLTREDETSVTIFTFYDTFIKNILQVFPNMIIKGVDYKDVPIPKHWKISERHIKDVRDLIFGETSAFQKFYKDKTLFPILEFIQKNSKDLIQLIDATNLFADIILNDNTVESTIINGNIISKLVKFYLLCSFYIYTRSIDMGLEVIGEDQSELLGLVDDGGMEDSVREQIIAGKKEQLNKKIAKLLGTYISLMETQKKKFNLNNEDIVRNVLKAKEKEKNKITRRLGDLTVEEREVENILKNQRLGDWSLGQTRALYEYDAEQYDKERQEIEDDMLMELRLNRNDEVTERNREIYRLEAIEEQVQRERVNAEMMAMFNAMPEDDDYGDRDGDEGY